MRKTRASIPEPREGDRALLERVAQDFDFGTRRRNEMAAIRAALGRRDQTRTVNTSQKRQALAAGRWSLHMDVLSAHFGDMFKSKRFLIGLQRAEEALP
ncbi:unnamed protein product [Zymoseptoria tritici ST99CH_3D7]|uniref:Uncharacterized protein n=1 Tax=Zymoseptoria tritici (strain ST99CH_3D7) TaxID=1276538 RepID=A0A1X7SA97_ZYMT9|nr:unnamed protein product [Zymoseptoria tritici ST99CH_3D7]